MKKTIKLLVVSIFLFLIISCKTIVWDDSVPLEETVLITIYSGVDIYSYNEVNVKWKGLTSVRIPAGHSEFILSALHEGGLFLVRENDIFLKYYFEAGNQYSITVGQEHLIGGNYGIVIENINNYQREFFPFP